MQELLTQIGEVASRGTKRPLPKLHFQTKTLHYSRLHWIQVHELQEHWKDARVDAEIVGDRRIRLTTTNVNTLALTPWEKMEGVVLEIDGQTVEMTGDAGPQGMRQHAHFVMREGDKWRPGLRPGIALRKTSLLHGPIDDAFMERFTVIRPTGKSKNPNFQQWCDFELEHFRQRWRALMRADLPEMSDRELLDLADRVEDLGTGHIVLWGDPDSNLVLKAFIDRLPVQFEDGSWKIRDRAFPGDRFVPSLIYPRPGSATEYLVLNSGLTFREGHDRTNSLQNPKLPDWAIIAITQPPDGLTPGRIHDAGFFNELWVLKGAPKAP